MKKFMFAFLAFAAFACAEQFTHIYRTVSSCTEIEKVDYCYVYNKGDAFVVFNYQDIPGDIAFLGSPLQIYKPMGKSEESTNSNGVNVWYNDYMAVLSGAEFRVHYTGDNLWFSSMWNGEKYCQTTRYWAYPDYTYRSVYKEKFQEVTLEQLKEKIARCAEGKKASDKEP